MLKRLCAVGVAVVGALLFIAPGCGGANAVGCTSASSCANPSCPSGCIVDEYGTALEGQWYECGTDGSGTADSCPTCATCS